VRRQRRSFRLLALILGVSLLAAACGGDDDDDADGAAEETGDEEATGGDLVLAAEQWPECLNPITQCSNAAWLNWTVLDHVLPKLMEVNPEGEFVPSPVLDGEPELSGEGTDSGEGPFTVTYTIAEDAQWDDGTPITSTDIKFTWETYSETTGVVSTAGYDQITDIDDSDPKTAVVTYEAPYAAWADRFGGTDYFWKADAFESANIADELATEFTFSGAPWILDSWSTEEAVLVPNENYWDEERQPLVDSVTFLPFEDTESEIAALRNGQVMAATPQPTPGIMDEIGDLASEVGFASQYEEVWFNQGSLLNPDTPLKDPAVREALAYAIDRQTALEEIVQPDIPETEQLQCSGWVPGIGEWCDTTDWEDVTYDPDHAADVLDEAGWVEGSDGIREKDGQRLSITWQTVEGNQRREDVQNLVIPQLAEIGIEVTPDNSDPGTLFEERLPQMQSEIMLYAWVTTPDPTVSDWAHCDQIPSAENEFSGQNNIGWCNQEASDLMIESDQAVDPDERLGLIQQVGDAMREDYIALPLWPLPVLTIWDDERLGGAVGEWNTTPYQGFGNIFDWSVEE
jgi:peptide/nickel transport system substrate-binding protein